MDFLYIIVNGLLLLSILIFVFKKFRERKRKKKAPQQYRRRPGETPFREPQRSKVVHPMYQPAHFDGERHRAENALNPESILACLTRNDTWAVEQPKDDG